MVLQILEELVGRSKAHLEGTILLLDIIAEPIGRILAFFAGIILKSTTPVAARTNILHSNRNATLGDVRVYLAKYL